jgi:parallel beta-helix repeat protein
VLVGWRHSVVLLVVLCATLAAAVEIHPTRAAGTIYIRADGSIDPSSTPINRTGDVYTLLANLTEANGIVIERSNIVLDGAHHLIHGVRDFAGVQLSNVHNVEVRNLEISAFLSGVEFVNSSHCTIYGCALTNNTYGVFFKWSGIHEHNLIDNNVITGSWRAIITSGRAINCSITDNRLINNGAGIMVGEEQHAWINTTIRGNDISNNTWSGIFFISYKSAGDDNLVIGNNITGNGEGISLYSGCRGNVISENNISANREIGVSLHWGPYGNTITDNRIEGNRAGILLDGSACDNEIARNSIRLNSEYGLYLADACNNSIAENNITGNAKGIVLKPLHHLNNRDNRIYHNTFDNDVQIASENSTNTWDAGYPAGGNYWSDYTGVDAQGDGLGDTSYIIDAANRDHYPLMQPWNGSAAPLTHVHLQPHDAVQAFMQSFTVNVTIANVTNLYGYNFQVHWNATLLNLLAVNVTPPAAWANSCIVIKNNVSDATYWHALSALAPASPFHGTTTLASLTFNLTATAWETLYNSTVPTCVTLDETMLADNTAHPITHGTSACGAQIRLVMMGDLNGDKAVNIFDVVRVAIVYGQSGRPGWMLEDVDCDGYITILDIVLVATNYGWELELSGDTMDSPYA